MSSRNSHLKNCVNKLQCKAHTAIEDLAAENCSRKNCLTMSALRNSLARRYPATYIITDCTQLLQQTKKTLQNPFAHHQCSVKVSDDVIWQDKNWCSYVTQDKRY